MDRVTRFERAVVFRVARGFFFFVAVSAVLVFAVGVFMGVRGVAETSVQSPPEPPRPVKSEPLTYASFNKQLADEAAQQAKRANQIGYDEGDEAQQDAQAEATRNELDARRAKLSSQLRELFSDPMYSWENVVEEYCAFRSAYGCLQTKTRVKTEGVVGVLSDALKGLGVAEAIDAMDALVGVLTGAPVADRGKLIGPIVAVVKRQIMAEAAAEREYAQAMAQHKRDHEAAVAENAAKHAQWRERGIYGVVAGFGLLVIISLFLAFLSMERHLRVLEMVVQGKTQDASGASPEA